MLLDSVHLLRFFVSSSTICCRNCTVKMALCLRASPPASFLCNRMVVASNCSTDMSQQEWTLILKILPISSWFHHGFIMVSSWFHHAYAKLSKLRAKQRLIGKCPGQLWPGWTTPHLSLFPVATPATSRASLTSLASLVSLTSEFEQDRHLCDRFTIFWEDLQISSHHATGAWYLRVAPLENLFI